MVTPAAHREAVAHLRTAYEMRVTDHNHGAYQTFGSIYAAER
jgi:hypothetical protein